MEEKNKKRIINLIAGTALLVGVLLSFYAFEKVSIPHVRDSHEMRPLIAGVVLILGGAGTLLYRWRQAKEKTTA